MPPKDEASFDEGTWLGTVDIDDNGASHGIIGVFESWDTTHHAHWRLLVRFRGLPVAWLNGSQPDAPSLIPGFADEALRTMSLTPTPQGDGSSISVIVCTHGRPAQVGRCIQRIRDNVDESIEIIVVDNAPRDNETRDAIAPMAEQDRRVHYVVEPRQGLSFARNRGMLEATGDLFVFTDDDTLIDAGWIAGVRQGFARSDRIGMVAGMVSPAEISTSAQRTFDEKQIRWFFDVEPEIYSMRERDRYSFLFPYSAGHIGAGANMSIRRKTVEEVGGFDVALGAGRATGGGEDLEMFVRVLRAGWDIAYEPSALVWHFHRADEEELKAQLLQHAIGTSAFLTSVAVQPGFVDFAKSVVGGLVALGKANKKMSDEGVEKGIIGLELRGMAAGPFVYARERFRLRSVSSRDLLRPAIR